MEENKEIIEALLPAYFMGRLSQEDKEQVDTWRSQSNENAKLFEEYRKLWESMDILNEMEQIDTHAALRKVDDQIKTVSYQQRFTIAFRRVAAILIIPLAVYALVMTFGNKNNKTSNCIAWQTMTTKSGMQGNVDLPDGSHVTLNSGSEIQYPTTFAKDIREVRLKGEAFFDVSKDASHPFVVNTGKMNVEVLGTTFNVANYSDSEPVEVVLASGSVSLITGSWQHKSTIGIMKPGQRAIFDKSTGAVTINSVEVDKYIAWKDGYMIFREDSMNDVVHKLEHWFNVDIYVQDKEIFDYQITAKFHHETLSQVLTLLKLSSNIEYTIENSNRMSNGEYTRTKIYLRNRNKKR